MPNSTFVAGRSRAVIVREMEERLHRGDLAAERSAAIEVRATPVPLEKLRTPIASKTLICKKWSPLLTAMRHFVGHVPDCRGSGT